jgi:hypothetical protein
MLVIYTKELLSPANPKLENLPLSVVRDCLYSQLIFHIPNPTTRHAAVTVTHAT